MRGRREQKREGTERRGINRDRWRVVKMGYMGKSHKQAAVLRGGTRIDG